MATPFTVVTEDRGDQAVVLVAGEIDLATAPRLEETLSRLIDRGATRLILDLSSTAFVDSNSTAVFLEAHKRLSARDGALTLRSPRPNVRKMLQITALDRLVRVD